MSDNARNFDDVSFGRTIQQLRRELGLTQRFVASQLGIDFTYLSKLENDRGEAPGEETIRGLAQILKADAEELLALAGKSLPSYDNEPSMIETSRCFFASSQGYLMTRWHGYIEMQASVDHANELHSGTAYRSSGGSDLGRLSPSDRVRC